MRLSQRLSHIEPFYVMECAKAAVQIAQSPECDRSRGGEPMIFLNIGEPDFTAPPQVQAAAAHAVQQGRSQYTDALGLPATVINGRAEDQKLKVDVVTARAVALLPWLMLLDRQRQQP